MEYKRGSGWKFINVEPEKFTFESMLRQLPYPKEVLLVSDHPPIKNDSIVNVVKRKMEQERVTDLIEDVRDSKFKGEKMSLENIFELLKKYNVRISISRCEPPFDNNLIIEVWNQDPMYFKIKKLFDIDELKKSYRIGNGL